LKPSGDNALKLFLLIVLSFIGSNLISGDTISVTFLGDTYFGESYQNDPHFNHGVNYLTEYGYDHYFSGISDVLLSSDFTIANFEASLADIKNFPPESPFEFIHYSNPDSTLYYLAKYHVNACSQANNHSMDFGYSGLKYSISQFTLHGIMPFGAGRNLEEASEPLHRTFSLNGKQIELFVIGCYWPRPAYESLEHFYANENGYGVNKLDSVMVAAQVKEIRSKYSDAVIIVYPHWGSNYKPKNSYQDSVAHSLIDAGVDLIIGHGAHTVQDIEAYHGKLILYNIGNFIFAAPGRYAETSALPYGFVVKLILTSGPDVLDILPIYTGNIASGYKVGGLMKSEFEECISKTIRSDSLRAHIVYHASRSFSIMLN
jgi:poly-gamma-glutamate capsule biosynthesis protein CapA/YwtB (metallophosphatase superfamily)